MKIEAADRRTCAASKGTEKYLLLFLICGAYQKKKARRPHRYLLVPILGAVFAVEIALVINDEFEAAFGGVSGFLL